MPAPTDTAHFTHDCEACSYLGHYDSAGVHFDLYACPGEPTVVVRYGNDGPEYSSGLVFTDSMPALGEAYRRAVAAGVEGFPVEEWMLGR